MKINPKYLNAKRRRLLKRIFCQSVYYITAQDIRELLKLFPDMESRRLFFQKFLPTISVARLHEVGILSRTDAEKYKLEYIRRNPLLQSRGAEELARTLNYENILLPTSTLPDAMITRLVSGDLCSSMTNEFNEWKREYRGAATLDMTPDEEAREKMYGSYEWIREGETFETANFTERLKDRIGMEDRLRHITNPDGLEKGGILRGTLTADDGSEVQVVYRIDELDRGVMSKNIVLTNITRGDGIRARGGIQETISYDDFVILLLRLKSGRFVDRSHFDRMVRSNELPEVADDEDIRTVAEMQRKMDGVDEAGKPYGFAVGTTFEMHADKPKDMYMASISRISETTQEVWLSNGRDTEGPFSWADFFATFKANKIRRTPTVRGRDDFLREVK